MKILVTGAAGFIGFHLSQKLLAKANEVIGLDNLNDYYDVSLKEARLASLKQHKDFSFYQLDLADKEGIANKIFLAFLLSIIFFNSLKA